MLRNPEKSSELRRGLLADEGQAATEYAIIASMTLIVIVAAIEGLQLALLNFYQDVASLICLPIP